MAGPKSSLLGSQKIQSRLGDFRRMTVCGHAKESAFKLALMGSPAVCDPLSHFEKTICDQDRDQLTINCDRRQSENRQQDARNKTSDVFLILSDRGRDDIGHL